ncbi:PEP-CTERM sorting domain-containing protein [Desulfococcaceae bacterium HSG7]|nr:PEP-CTERM sorting domain-containing protein [Desulfococcaceae bacterium HSG7]
MKVIAVRFFMVLVISVIGVMPVSALTVYDDYIYDEETDLTWLRNLKRHAGYTHGEKVIRIAEMDDEGASWAMATEAEVMSLLDPQFGLGNMLGVPPDTEGLFPPTGVEHFESDVYVSDIWRWYASVAADDVSGEEQQVHFRATTEGFVGMEISTRYDWRTLTGVECGYYPLVGAWVVAAGDVAGEAPVPEPGTWLLMTVGLGAMIWVRRKRK